MKPRYRILRNEDLRIGDWVLFTTGWHKVISVVDTVSSILYEYKLRNYEASTERILLGSRDLADWHPFLKVREV